MAVMEKETEQINIRNFAIIAHVDHGKSTLADRILELTGAVSKREMRAQYLDSLDLERERGITIKLKAVRLSYPLPDDLREILHFDFCTLNLVDTPGHVDFGYEVSRSLAAGEGAVLVVDASQGIQAQTVANVLKAREQKLKILTFINKIDLGQAQPEKVRREVQEAFGFSEDEIILGSAKTGQGVEDLLRLIVEKIPPPDRSPLISSQDGSLQDDLLENRPLRALIFDSLYDEYLGALAFVRIFEGEIKTGQAFLFLSNGQKATALEMGVLTPRKEKVEKLGAGDVGFIATGVKDLHKIKIGDTITGASDFEFRVSDLVPLPGYREPKPMVFLGLYPINQDDFLKLRMGLEKIYLTDSSLSFVPESSPALGHGFRGGFLGLLHADVIRERLEREFGLSLITTLPSVAYQVWGRSLLTQKESPFLATSAAGLPDPSGIKEIHEPWLTVFVFAPISYLGAVMTLCQNYRGLLKNSEYFGGSIKATYEMPLAEIVTDFFDRLKSITAGYASLDYEFLEYRLADVVQLDILVAGELAAPLSRMVIREKAYDTGKKTVARLKELLPQQQFVVTLQASIGGPSTGSRRGKIIAREDIPALRKNVLAKMSGGDRGRKDKLLEKQKKGKERLKRFGRVEIPTDVFTKLFKLNI